MVHLVDFVAYSFLIVAIGVTVFQRIQGDLDGVSFVIGRGLELLQSGELNPQNNSEGLAHARYMLETLSHVANPNFNFDINKVDVDNERGEAFLNVRIYNFDTSSESPLRGVLVWYHGGGWVQGNIEADDTMCSRMASLTNFVVVSVSYRMAPEFPYPTPLTDSIHALNWVSANIYKYGGDATRLFVAGESAGGNLATSLVASRIRDSLMGQPPPGGSVLGLLVVYPSLDNKDHLESHKINSSVGLLSMPQMMWFRRLYSGNNESLLTDESEYLFAPLYTPSSVLARFPSTRIVLASHDVLLDEGVLFAEKLRQEGVSDVQLDVFNGTIHGFFGRRIFPQGFLAMDKAMEWMQTIYPNSMN